MRILQWKGKGSVFRIITLYARDDIIMVRAVQIVVTTRGGA